MSESVWSKTHAISIYTADWIVTGVLALTTPIRLSDFLNTSTDDFLLLQEARVFDLAGQRLENALQGELWLVHRQEILILHEAPSAQQAPREGRTDQRVEKHPRPILAYLGPYRLEGTIYLPKYASLDGYLNGMAETFLSLTAVSISLPGREDPWIVQTPFALVRKTRLFARSETPPA